MLRKPDDTPAETREQRRNGVRMVIILAGGQIAQFVLGFISMFLSSNPHFAVTHACLFQCFQASYTAVILMLTDKDTYLEVRKMLAVLTVETTEH